MALKDLLVHVDGSKSNSARLDAAIRLAGEHDAHLAGLYVLPIRNVLPPFTEAHIPKEVLDAQKEAAREQAAAAEQAFTEATKRAGLSAEWRAVEGDPASTLSLHARYVDLLLLGQADDSDTCSLDQGLVEEVVLDAGRPVLMIPYIGAPDTIGKNVLVAWNGSREAMRAVHEAMPFLERADSVDVLSINPPKGRAGDGDIPGADLSLHLARHGVKARASHVEADDIDAGELLLSRAADQQADLIVMGAYGHSRYRELVLGGATRQILQSMTVPVLMSH